MSVQDYFNTSVLISGLNSNVIVLIPKVKGASSVGDFRLIALGNFQFKCVSKILADRYYFYAYFYSSLWVHPR